MEGENYIWKRLEKKQKKRPAKVPTLGQKVSMEELSMALDYQIFVGQKLNGPA
jgi:hypothetical protein